MSHSTPEPRRIGPVDAEVDRVFLREHADVAIAFDENPVARQQLVHFVNRRGKFLQKLPQHRQKIRRHIVGQTADARVAGREPRAADALAQVVNLLALAERAQEHRHRPDVQRHRADAEQVRTDAREFRADDADVFAPRRHVHAQQFLHGVRVGDVVGQRREVIEAVGVRNELRVRHVLGDFFVAAMQVTDIGPGVDDLFAVQLEHEPQHAVRARVLRPHVDDHPLAAQLSFHRLLRARGGIDQFHFTPVVMVRLATDSHG